MKLKTKIDSELSWIVPYLRRVKHIVDLDKLEQIRSMKFDKRVNRGSYARCVRRGTRYDIYIDKYYQDFLHKSKGKCEPKLRHHSKIDVLCLLAHELAHMIVWEQDHSPEHKMLEARLTGIFMKKLMKENYINEEDEFRTKD